MESCNNDRRGTHPIDRGFGVVNSVRHHVMHGSHGTDWVGSSSLSFSPFLSRSFPHSHTPTHKITNTSSVAPIWQSCRLHLQTWFTYCWWNIFLIRKIRRRRIYFLPTPMISRIMTNKNDILRNKKTKKCYEGQIKFSLTIEGGTPPKTFWFHLDRKTNVMT